MSETVYKNAYTSKAVRVYACIRVRIVLYDDDMYVYIRYVYARLSQKSSQANLLQDALSPY